MDVTSKIRMIILGLLAMLLVNVLVAFLQQLLLRASMISPVTSGGVIPAYMRNMSGVRVWTEIVLLAPIFEETAFRGILQTNNRIFQLSLSMAFYLLVCKCFHLNFYELTYGTAFVIVMAACLSFLRIAVPEHINIRRSILFSSLLAFTFWHYDNFHFHQANLLTIGISLLPFFLNGCILTYVSMRYGLGWSIIIHMFNNAWPLLLWY
jgi:membrane protease YdiL (CAAX protease family)